VGLRRSTLCGLEREQNFLSELSNLLPSWISFQSSERPQIRVGWSAHCAESVIQSKDEARNRFAYEFNSKKLRQHDEAIVKFQCEFISAVTDVDTQRSQPRNLTRGREGENGDTSNEACEQMWEIKIHR
jgi:hypothetical protein